MTTAPGVIRRDTLPENTNYVTGRYYALGCHINPIPLGCLSCPLPQC